MRIGLISDTHGLLRPEAAAFMRAETAKWLKVVKQANIRLQ